jgi:F-type H+-transporting ATPase subunit b
LRRAPVLVCLFVLLAAVCLQAQHAEAPAGEAAHGGSAEHGDSSALWKWANFALLAGGLGYLIYKKGLPFFTARNQEIRNGIDEAARLREQAEAHAAGIERRLANLTAEIEQIRGAARHEMEAEAGRLRRENEQALRKVQEHAGQEIESAAKTARKELKAYSAELALQLAEERIRARLTPSVDETLVRAFVDDLGRRPQPGQEAR